jgi:hypothetical protein
MDNFLTTSALAKMASVSRVTVWKAACAGEFDGAIRTRGGHFRLPPESGEPWANKIRILRREKNRRHASRQRLRAAQSQTSGERGTNSGFATIEGISARFETWLRHCPANRENRIFETWWRHCSVENWPVEKKRKVLEEVWVIAEFAIRLASDLGVKLGQLTP